MLPPGAPSIALPMRARSAPVRRLLRARPPPAPGRHLSQKPSPGRPPPPAPARPLTRRPDPLRAAGPHRRAPVRMCGIIGIYKRDGQVSVELYEGLLMLQHRGQDSAGAAGRQGISGRARAAGAWPAAAPGAQSGAMRRCLGGGRNWLGSGAGGWGARDLVGRWIWQQPLPSWLQLRLQWPHDNACCHCPGARLARHRPVDAATWGPILPQHAHAEVSFAPQRRRGPALPCSTSPYLSRPSASFPPLPPKAW
jgi:hypothetical protein